MYAKYSPYFLRNFLNSALQHYKLNPANLLETTIMGLKKIPKNRLTYSTDVNISKESD